MANLLAAMRSDGNYPRLYADCGSDRQSVHEGYRYSERRPRPSLVRRSSAVDSTAPCHSPCRCIPTRLSAPTSVLELPFSVESYAPLDGVGSRTASLKNRLIPKLQVPVITRSRSITPKYAPNQVEEKNWEKLTLSDTVGPF